MQYNYLWRGSIKEKWRDKGKKDILLKKKKKFGFGIKTNYHKKVTI